MAPGLAVQRILSGTNLVRILEVSSGLGHPVLAERKVRWCQFGGALLLGHRQYRCGGSPGQLLLRRRLSGRSTGAGPILCWIATLEAPFTHGMLDSVAFNAFASFSHQRLCHRHHLVYIGVGIGKVCASSGSHHSTPCIRCPLRTCRSHRPCSTHGLVCLASHPARSPLQHCGARRILNRPGVSLPLARIRGGGHPRSGGRPPRRQLPCGSHRTGCGDHRSGGLTGAVRSIEPTRLSSLCAPPGLNRLTTYSLFEAPTLLASVSRSARSGELAQPPRLFGVVSPCSLVWRSRF
jgi:hypothetical protein